MKTQLKLELLLEEALTLEYWTDGSGVKMSVTQSGGIPINAPTILLAIDEIASYRKQEALNVMINRLPAGVMVPIHRDFLKPTKHQPKYPTVERWHLPIKTNPCCWWWDQQHGRIPMLEGLWYGPVPFWLPHEIGNFGLEERIHLIVDLDTPNPIGYYE